MFTTIAEVLSFLEGLGVTGASDVQDILGSLAGDLSNAISGATSIANLIPNIGPIIADIQKIEQALKFINEHPADVTDPVWQLTGAPNPYDPGYQMGDGE